MTRSHAVNILLSTGKQDWGTPLGLYRALDKEFRFGLDASADVRNFKHPNYLGPDQNKKTRRDALSVDWAAFCEPGYPAVWLNPPYSRDVGLWVEKAYQESRKGLLVACLLFSRTETQWWQQTVWKADQVRFIEGRLSFVDPETNETRHPATAPSALVIFSPDWNGPPSFRRMAKVNGRWQTRP